MTKKSAVLLLSGGLDSATAGAWAKREGYDLLGLTVSYGQVHAIELEAARRVGLALGLRDHRYLDVNLGQWGGSALVESASAIPVDRTAEHMAKEIPVTYVPARNTIFLSLALSFAEASGSEAIVLGVNAIDYSGYPDCRPEFLRAFEAMARLATKVGIEQNRAPTILAPLLEQTKSDIIRLGAALGVDYGLTHSCYRPEPDGRSCGRCDSCILRQKGFAEAGLKDPIYYADAAGAR